MKKIIIIGATSGIGRELAKIYAGSGALVAATGRRQELLYSLQLEYPNNIITQCFDVTGNDNLIHIKALITKLDGLDLVIYNAGYGEPSKELNWQIDKTTVDTNVNGFIEIVNFAFNYFLDKKFGHIAATSSIASIRGNSAAPAYNASKAFMSSYMEGLYMKAKKLNSSGIRALNLAITDIQPGFVATKMKKASGQFWVAPVEKAAKQIYMAIEKKKWRVYITRRWSIIAALLKWVPGFIYHRIA